MLLLIAGLQQVYNRKNMEHSISITQHTPNYGLAQPPSNSLSADNQLDISLPIHCAQSQYQSNLRLTNEELFVEDHQDNQQIELFDMSNSGQLAPNSLYVSSQKPQDFFNELQTIIKEKLSKNKPKKLRRRICTYNHDCAICHEKVRRKSAVYRLSCRHIFHVGCLDKWKMNKNSCPLCRKQLI